MGNICNSSDQNDAETRLRKEEERKNKKLEQDINRDQGMDRQVNKLLLLGAGESGKSTLFKQMIKIYGKGFPLEDRKGYKNIIFNNIITSIQTLVEQIDAFGGLANKELQVACDKIMELKGDEDVKTVAEEIAALWSDEGVLEAYNNRASFQLTDSANYFFDKIEEVADPEWIPSEQDVLRSRVRTTGIVENEFIIDSNQFKMYDVGGQRNERKKWIHCFENVTAVLFVSAISAYDMVLYEDENTNRMVEALALFAEICNSRWFQTTSMILFLNKRDLFTDKVNGTPAKPHVPITVCPAFAEFPGPEQDVDAAVEFIEDQFLIRNRNPDKQVYYHVTCATDTGNVAAVFNAVKDIIIRKSLDEAGLV